MGVVVMTTTDTLEVGGSILMGKLIFFHLNEIIKNMTISSNFSIRRSSLKLEEVTTFH